MPTYEFRCPDGHEFEKFYRSISGGESQALCPVCGKPAERMMSAAGFAFKGSGFYLTDYGKNAHRGEAPPETKSGANGTTESSPDSPRSDGAKSEATAATTSEGAKGEGAKGDGAKGDGAKGDSSKGSESSRSSSEPTKTESKAGDSKPAQAAPKPSASE
jgi:putative FmdB family regulatory protein